MKNQTHLPGISPSRCRRRRRRESYHRSKSRAQSPAILALRGPGTPGPPSNSPPPTPRVTVSSHVAFLSLWLLPPPGTRICLLVVFPRGTVDPRTSKTPAPTPLLYLWGLEGDLAQSGCSIRICRVTAARDLGQVLLILREARKSVFLLFYVETSQSQDIDHWAESAAPAERNRPLAAPSLRPTPALRGLTLRPWLCRRLIHPRDPR